MEEDPDGGVNLRRSRQHSNAVSLGGVANVRARRAAAAFARALCARRGETFTNTPAARRALRWRLALSRRSMSRHTAQ